MCGIDSKPCKLTVFQPAVVCAPEISPACAESDANAEKQIAMVINFFMINPFLF
tara:strand:- start:252 stop:413 length:162 start_codon:yes stop_codon:yes gene_type:complete